MPDLFTHFATGYLLGRTRFVKRYIAALVIGTMLPDVFTRIPGIVLQEFLHLPIYHFFSAFHTPAGLLLICYLLSFAFTQQERKLTFFYLFFGAMLHFFIDLMQRQFHEGIYMPYFPLRFKTIQWGWFDINASVYLFPLLFVLVIWIWKKGQQNER